jgi:acetyltransferase-like isoleucine patch superfamily enzyme
MKILKTLFNLYYKLRISWLKKKGIIIGENTFISHKAYIDSHNGANVVIGSNCFITRNVIILNHTDTSLGGPIEKYTRFGGKRILGDIIIEDDVFVGVGSVVMPGVKIGRGSIIGALSVVNRDVPAYSVYAGSPAKMITTVEKVLEKTTDFDLDSWLKEFKIS